MDSRFVLERTGAQHGQLPGNARWQTSETSRLFWTWLPFGPRLKRSYIAGFKGLRRMHACGRSCLQNLPVCRSADHSSSERVSGLSHPTRVPRQASEIRRGPKIRRLATGGCKTIASRPWEWPSCPIAPKRTYICMSYVGRVKALSGGTKTRPVGGFTKRGRQNPSFQCLHQRLSREPISAPYRECAYFAVGEHEFAVRCKTKRGQADACRDCKDR